MRVALFGVTGMLGATLYKHLSSDPALQVMGLMRGDPLASSIGELPSRANTFLIDDVVHLENERLLEILSDFAPNVIVNCIGRRRQPKNSSELIELIAANSLWPHRLAMVAGEIGARLIHFSSDAIFSGKCGNYSEGDLPDPVDSYGVSKLLGEPAEPHCLTVRTSIIGHAFQGSDQLVDWLLRQNDTIHGFENVIFSGLPTIEIASIIHDILLPRTEMAGIWHVAAEPISKFELLRLIVERYGIDLEVVPSTAGLASNRSLNASKFREVSGYEAPSWPALIDRMFTSR